MNLDKEMAVLLKKIDNYFILFPNATSISILEGELANIEDLLYILKGKGVIGLFKTAEVETSKKKNALEDILYMFDVDRDSLEKFKKKFYDHLEKTEIKFNNENSVLSIDDKEIKVKLKNDKPVEHYILEYIFQNEEGLKAKSYYMDILENKFQGDNKTERSLYRACKALNEKVSKHANISNFLIFESGKTGAVWINPKYL